MRLDVGGGERRQERRGRQRHHARPLAHWMERGKRKRMRLSTPDQRERRRRRRRRKSCCCLRPLAAYACVCFSQRNDRFGASCGDYGHSREIDATRVRYMVFTTPLQLAGRTGTPSRRVINFGCHSFQRSCKFPTSAQLNLIYEFLLRLVHFCRSVTKVTKVENLTPQVCSWMARVF